MLREVREELAGWESGLIETARGEGASWADLAGPLGVASLQAAERRYPRPGSLRHLKGVAAAHRPSPPDLPSLRQPGVRRAEPARSNSSAPQNWRRSALHARISLPSPEHARSQAAVELPVGAVHPAR